MNMAAWVLRFVRGLILRMIFLWRVLRFTSARKRRLKREASENRVWLRPGLWSLVWRQNGQAPVAVHARSRLRADVRALTQPLPTQATASFSFPFADVMLRWIQSAAPPWTFWIRGQGRRQLANTTTSATNRGRGAYTVLIPHRSGPPLLLQPGRSVRRAQALGGAGEQNLTIRRSLDTFLPVPACSVISGGTHLEEDFVDGVPLERAPMDAQLGAIEQLLHRLADGAGEVVSEASEGYVISALEFAAALDPVPDPWRRQLSTSRPGIERASLQWPLMPAHGDLTPSNVILSSDGPVTIDLEYAQVLPFFFDAFRLVIETSSRMSASYVDQALSILNGQAVHALFDVHGLVLDDAQLACCLTVYPSLAAYHYRSEAEAPDRRTRATNMLTFQWERVEPLLTALHPAAPG